MHAQLDERRVSTVSAHDVAEAFRALQPGLGVVKLHKLLYYAQGWHLALTGQPLFEEAIEAWTNGPVVAELWADEKHERGRPAPKELDGEQRSTVAYVADVYGRSTGKALIRMTHVEDPWRQLSEIDDPRLVDDPTISHQALTDWFTSTDEFLAHDAEVKRLSARTDVFGFGPIDVAGLDDLIGEALDRQVVDERQ